MGIPQFVLDGVRAMLRGRRPCWTWLAGLALVVDVGPLACVWQSGGGLVITDMSDPVPWSVSIVNFAFRVGIAAAAVLLPSMLRTCRALQTLCVVVRPPWDVSIQFSSALPGAWHTALPACVASWGEAPAGGAVDTFAATKPASGSETAPARIAGPTTLDLGARAVVEGGFPRGSAPSQHSTGSRHVSIDPCKSVKLDSQCSMSM